MDPVYLDLHIHTSQDPSSLNPDYDIDLLYDKISEFCDGSTFMISLTDHNTINKSAYLKAKEKFPHLILGVEIHIRNFTKADFYHCHIYFNVDEITGGIIDDLNDKLNELYPDKSPTKNNESIPKILDVINIFDGYDFIFLPHAGQNHSTFEKSIPKGGWVDDILMRSVYHNQFDGFTGRSNTRLKKTQEWFSKLGISDFVNLITCSDNYSPARYPSPKAKEAAPLVPTWMLAMPTFAGLRLSLSESSRLVYGEKPQPWRQYLEGVTLKTDDIDIDINLTPGLNVVIGGSSSGKSLLVDSIYKKINNEDFNEGKYSSSRLGLENIEVVNPTKVVPHYINQNYIIDIIDDTDEDNGLDDVLIIKKTFGGDEDAKEIAEKILSDLRKELNKLINSVKAIEVFQEELKRIPILSELLSTEQIRENLINHLLPEDNQLEKIKYSKIEYDEDAEQLNKIKELIENHPIVDFKTNEIDLLIGSLKQIFDISELEQGVRKIIENKKSEIDAELRSESNESQDKQMNWEQLLKTVSVYSKNIRLFNSSLKKISGFKAKFESKEVRCLGHRLFIENCFELNQEKFLEVLNKYLKTGLKVSNFDDLKPEKIFESNFFKKNPKVADYDDFVDRICSDFAKLNKKTYRIITNEGKNFENLSPGLKTSVILDIILGYDGDSAPIIIDQPEDNLATSYINKGLIEAIMRVKQYKQIILVSHNATIPMLGDAQNVILCENSDNKIKIRANKLESRINGKSSVDHIARITDGGKSSIKKRVKKYNLKQFK